MTSRELFPKYIELFSLVMETRGQEIGNEVYKKTREIIKKNKNNIDKMIEDDLPFPAFITALEFFLISEIHSIEKLRESGEENIKYLVDSMFDLYIKKPTRDFTAKYGLPVVNSLDIYIKILFVKEKL